MRTRSTWLGWVLVGCLAGLLVGGPVGVGRAQAPGSAGMVRIGLDVDAGTGDPRFALDSSAYRLGELVYDGLVYLNNRQAPEPSLASSWDTPTPTTWVFHLRRGVTFHDGQPFTADDVVYTFETILDPSSKAPYRSLYTPITKVEKVDAYTVRMTTSAPYAPLLSYLNIGIVPKHIGEKNDGSLASHPVGTGPFRFVSWDRGSKITLEANARYWGGAPKVRGLVINIVPDNSARAAAVEAGDLDFIHSPLSPQDVARLRKSSNLIVTKMTGLGITYLNINTSVWPLSDVKVRQALAYLTDRQAIAADIYQGMDQAATSLLTPGLWAYTGSVRQPEYNPAKARALLQEDGFTLQGGVYEKDGKPLAIELWTHSEDPNRVQAVEFLQNAWQKYGFRVKVSTNEWPTFSSAVYASKHQVALLGWLNIVDPDRLMFNQFTSNGGQNWEKYSNPTVDALLQRGRTTLDRAARAKIYQQAAQILANDQPYDVLLYQGYVVVQSAQLHGFVPNPSGNLKTLDAVTLGGR
ncbi:MAG TPA: ABC transporter substrate-binding protein [bacterium]|nr:ABC transporter substrate-binding protein [bacterium]